jgi:hypothetical protein
MALRAVFPTSLVLCCSIIGGLFACVTAAPSAPFQTPTPGAALTCTPAPQITSGEVILVPPTVPSTESIPVILGMTACIQRDAQGNLIAVHYQDSDGIPVATFDPSDRFHNHRVTWDWQKMTQAEKDQALWWIFDLKHMQYSRFENREEWVINTMSKWIPRITDFALPTNPDIAIHWQRDGPLMSQNTLYEALSRIKSLTLVRERRTCNYGHSHLGLIEYGGETILFTAPGWQKFSMETREIFTVVWTIKEAMVIYYPQSLGWTSSCPSESTHLKVEYYSMIWLIKAQQVLSKLVPSDRAYWEEQEILFQIRNLTTQTFPLCLSPALLPVAGATSTPEPCSPLP